jgi:hypothetical protein
MDKSLKSSIKRIISETIVDENIVRQKMTNLLNSLRNTVNDIENNWNSKEREDFIYNQVISLDFVNDGEFIIKNKPCIRNLKEVYNSSDPSKFTTITLSECFKDIDIDTNSIYFIKEPFGSKASPDFLIISKKGILGIEDKSSKRGKVSFNAGTPGGNKFIMFYDKKQKNIHLISGENWGWGENIEKEYKIFTKEMIQYAKSKFDERFGDRIKNMTYYARPMLVDKNKVKDIWDKDEESVMYMLRKHF